jgi:hypothetical protein
VSHWKATIHIYNLKKFQKIQKFIAFTSACPESLNPTYGSPRPLGVKGESKQNRRENKNKGDYRGSTAYQNRDDIVHGRKNKLKLSLTLVQGR